MKRLPEEDFKAYKNRRTEYNTHRRSYMKGRFIWNKGTYIKAIHGGIGYVGNNK